MIIIMFQKANKKRRGGQHASVITAFICPKQRHYLLFYFLKLCLSSLTDLLEQAVVAFVCTYDDSRDRSLIPGKWTQLGMPCNVIVFSGSERNAFL